MYSFVLLLVAIFAFVEVSPSCPFPEFELCGSDGTTYKNVCEWKLATLINPELQINDLGSCEKHSSHELYRAFLAANANEDVLRSRSKKRDPKKRQGKSGDTRLRDSLSIAKKLSSLPFHFRRNP